MGALEVAIIHSNGGRCVMCNALAEQVDHVKPRHAGGPTVPENLMPLCDWCNRIKSCMWPGHGYHPIPDHEDSGAAINILDTELGLLEAVYGISRLWEVVGEDVPYMRMFEEWKVAR